MPPRYTGQEHHGCSPPLEWDGAPAATRTFALTAATPDAAPGGQTCWVLFNVPRHICRLPEAIPAIGRIRQVACSGVNDFQTVGYVPPCRPARAQGWCVFILYALDIELSCGPRTDRAALHRAMHGHVLAVARLTARCECCPRMHLPGMAAAHQRNQPFSDRRRRVLPHPHEQKTRGAADGAGMKTTKTVKGAKK